ncbi:MAG: ABC transporter permease [Phycisphaeraceae bacterium]|nr:ABC transporter permease [Phycisphaeraceae bacterium]
MYQRLITRRYLLSKVMPLLAAVAVALCTGMVLIVWSVMGGFLTQLLASGKSLMGDVSITIPVQGIPYYEELIDRLEADTEYVAAATPVIQTLALMNLEIGAPPADVILMGIEPEGYDRVAGYYDLIYWRHIDKPLRKDKLGIDMRLAHRNPGDPLYGPPGSPREGLRTASREELDLLYERGKAMGVLDPASNEIMPAAVVGTMVTKFNWRRPEGFIEPGRGLFAPSRTITLTVLPMSDSGVMIEPEEATLPIANEFSMGVYQVDSKYVLIPFALLQKMLKMDQATRVDPDWQPGSVTFNADGTTSFNTGTGTTIEPARATTIFVRAAEGVTPDQLDERVEQIFDAFYEEKMADHYWRPSTWRENTVFTWEQEPNLRFFIAAVKKETTLVLVLFALISLVSVVLLFSIFWSMVSEKTKDVGILRALGASRMGVAWLFMRYGLLLGLVGSIAGLALAYLIVTNINPIHEWMGRALGVQVWDPSVYYFMDIPNKVDPMRALLVAGVGSLSALVGAIAPAVRAAWMDPVKALRFE